MSVISTNKYHWSSKREGAGAAVGTLFKLSHETLASTAPSARVGPKVTVLDP